MQTRIRLLSAVLCGLCAAPALAAAPRYGVTVFDAAPNSSAAFAIGNDGTVLGLRYDEEGGPVGPFAWRAGQTTMLPPQFEAPRALSAAGHIVGHSPIYSSAGGSQLSMYGLVYHHGALSRVPEPFTPDYSAAYRYSLTSAIGVNSAGTVLARQDTNNGSGYYLSANGVNTVLPLEAASAINEAGQVAGASDSGAGTRAVLYDDGNLVDLGVLPTDGAAPRSIARDLNDAGAVVGTSLYGDGALAHDHSFIWRDGAMLPIGDFTGANWARGVNNHGDVVGIFHTSGVGLDRVHSYLFRDGAQYDLAELLGGGGWRVIDVVDINDGGQIIGYACNAADACYSVLMSPVPEPGAYGMLLAGLAGLAAAGGRGRGGLRRRAAA